MVPASREAAGWVEAFAGLDLGGLHSDFIGAGPWAVHRDRMRGLACCIVAVTACGSPPGSYVAAVYQDGAQLSVKICNLSHNDVPNPEDCHVEPVGPTPRTELMSSQAPPTALELLEVYAAGR